MLGVFQAGSRSHIGIHRTASRSNVTAAKPEHIAYTCAVLRIIDYPEGLGQSFKVIRRDVVGNHASFAIHYKHRMEGLNSITRAKVETKDLTQDIPSGVRHCRMPLLKSSGIRMALQFHRRRDNLCDGPTGRQGYNMVFARVADGAHKP